MMPITKDVKFEKKKVSHAIYNTDIKYFTAGKIISSCRNLRIILLSLNEHYPSYALRCLIKKKVLKFAFKMLIQ